MQAPFTADGWHDPEQRERIGAPREPLNPELDALMKLAFTQYGQLDEDGRSPIDVLLASNSSLPAEERAVLVALARGWFSVFEIRHIRVDEGMELFDVLHRKKLSTLERSATRQVHRGDLLAGWVMVEEGGTTTLEGAICHVPSMYAPPFVAVVRDLHADLGRDASMKQLDWKKRTALIALLVAPLHEAIHLSAPTPQLVNRSGDFYPIGNHAFTCVATDDTGLGDSASCTVTVTDTQAPTATCNGATVECSGATTPVQTNCSGADLCDPAVAASSSASAAYPIGTHAFTCTAADASGNQDVASCQVVVVDSTAASVGTVVAPVAPVAKNAVVSASAEFTAACGPHTATIAWGDGTTSAGVVSEGAGGGSVSGSHAYAAAGVYTLTVTVTDASGNAASAIYQYVVVYDPIAGFVTGAGFIQSPAGAYPADPTLAGKAHFGFVAKYQQGANTPTGNTNFRFQAAGLSFESASYDWLVVAGANAKYKGVGTLDGVAGHAFLLTATDGDAPGGGGADRFRIKISAPGGGVIYDNQPGAADDANASQAVAAGNIRIQQQ